ncbi:MAG: glycosyltransferase family 4 protein [Prevotellaceae bacterium]|jgi:glycosyltransferase involved in cell wall biosynthesis|nr:glycosyltransferase family 4 protein [Prevotellaceae bacterium]
MMKKTKTLAMLCLSDGFGGLEMNAVRLAKWLNDLEYFSVVLIGGRGTPVMQLAQDMQLPVAFTKSYTRYMDVLGAYRLLKILRSTGAEALFAVHNRNMSLLAVLRRVWRYRKAIVYQQHMDLVIDKKDALHTLRFAAIDLWIAPLDGIRSDVLRHTRVNPNKIKVIPLGVDVDTLLAGRLDMAQAQAQLSVKPQRPLLGIVGRIDRLKGQLVLLQAMKLLQNRNIFVEALIAGEPTRNERQEYMEALLKFVHDSNLRSFVHFCPFTADVATVYSAVDALVMASQRETYGMVTAEAMLFGLPVVGTRAGGTVELLGSYDGYLLFEPGNAEDLADKLQEMLAGMDDFKAKARQASARAASYFSHVEKCRAIKVAIDELEK